MGYAGGTLTRNKSGYLPSLDGWRAIAILGVIMTHDHPWVIRGHSNVNWKGYGGYGVYLFFAISGVLICTRILRDEKSLGSFHIRDFYIRRLFRIQPAAFAYLGVIAVFIATGIVHERWHFWFGGLLLYQNFLYHTKSWPLIMAGYFTGHFWTLALEEHFYILLSIFLFFVRRNRAFVMALILLCLALGQHEAHNHGWYSDDTSTRRTFWLLQYLFVPAFLALVLNLEAVYEQAKRLLVPWVTYLGIFGVLSADHLLHYGTANFWQRSTFDLEVKHFLLSLGFVVIATMLHPESWSTRLLEWKPLRFLGRLSYSIYVWHLLFLCTGEPDTHITWPPLVVLGHRPTRYVGILALSLLSYYYIEKPLIRFGHRIAPPATPGHADLEANPSLAVRIEAGSSKAVETRS